MLIIPIIFFQLTTSVNAAEVNVSTFTKGKFEYEITKTATNNKSGTVSIGIRNKYKDTIKKAVIPKTVEYQDLVYQVTSIGESGFYQCSELSSVVIPDTVTGIESLAFGECVSLKSIAIPESVTTMKTDSFYGCSANLVISCDTNSKAYHFASKKGIRIKENNKLIIIGDSRSNNMSKWIIPSVRTEFVAEAGQGYQWFVQEAIDEVNEIKNPGDTIVIWLGVNDYYSNILGGNTWTMYANIINSLAVNEWSDCKINVAAVGYVDRTRMLAYYGKDTRSNVTPLDGGNGINGIQDFNLKLKESLCKKVSWLDTYRVIGINANDTDRTPEDIWYTRANGQKDGLHYSESKTQEIYDFFVANTIFK